MPNEYDKIFKENIEAIILPIADRLLGIHLEQLEEIPGDLQITLERKPDFTKKALDKNKQPFILHLEFQVDDGESIREQNETTALHTAVGSVAQLRNLREETTKQIQTMPITFDF